MEDTLLQMPNVKKQAPKGQVIFKIFIYIMLTGLSVIVIIPFFYLIVTSMKSLDEISLGISTIFPREFSFIENFKFVIGHPKYNFIRAFFNTMLIFALKTVGVLVTCSISAYGFSRFRCKINNFVFFAFIAVLFLPGELLSIPFYEAMVALNIRYDSFYLPLWMGAWFGIDITTIFLFKQFFIGTPSSLTDAAKIDGCNEFTAFVRIVLPLAKSVIITTIILYFVGTYNDIYGPTLYIRQNDWEHKLVAQTIGIFEGLFNMGSVDFLVPFNYVAVCTLISILPTILFFSFAQRYFVESFVSSGVKG